MKFFFCDVAYKQTDFLSFQHVVLKQATTFVITYLNFIVSKKEKLSFEPK